MRTNLFDSLQSPFFLVNCANERRASIFLLEKFITRFFISAVNFYRIWISPLKPPTCRFIPTCSTYALEALKKYGWKRGIFLTIKRILRCNPFCKGGYDPVP